MRYYPEYSAARARLENTNDLDVLLQTIDTLFGREKLKYGDGIEQVRAEALRQLEIEMRDREYEARNA